MIQYQFQFISIHKQNKTMIQPIAGDQQPNEFLLKDQLKEEEINILQFLFNSDFQIARQSLDQKTAIHTQIKKYQRSVAVNSEDLRRLFHALSQKLREKFLREDSECLKALNKLQTLWQVKKIEIFHRYFFEKYIQNTPLKSVVILIRNEDHLIRMEQHIYYSIEKAIWAREACMNHLKRQFKVLGPQDLYEHLQTVKDRQLQKNRKLQQKLYKVYGYRAQYILDQREAKLGVTKMQNLSEDINNYRKLTYHLIELISNWKMYIQSLTNDLRLRREKIQFYYKDYNLMLSILNDSSFISTSFLSNFYKFSIKNDPFLLKPVLNIEKSLQEGSQIPFETHQLKKIIDCKLDDIPKIIIGLNQLSKQVEWNIVHKKYLERTSFVKSKGQSMQKINSQGILSPIKSIKQTNLSPQNSMKKSLSLLTKQKSVGLTKSNVLQRKAPLISELSMKNTMANTFGSKQFRINNPEAKRSKLFDSQQLQKLKSEIYKKVKDQLEYETKKSIIGSKMFSDIVDQEVKISFQKHLNDQEQQILQNTLQITPLSFSQQEIGSYLTQIYKFIPGYYLDLQITQEDLLKQVNEVNYSYILKVHSKKYDVANVVAFRNRQTMEYKSIEIKLISFKFAETFQKIVLKIIQFLWKYDNAKEIIFNLRFNNQQTQTFVKQLQKKLEPNCKVIEKRYKGYVQAKFIFINKEFNKKYVYNPHPQKVHFKLYSALCIEPVLLQTIETNQVSTHLNYDYLVMEVLKRFTNSQDFYILRDTFKSKDRLRYLLTQLMEIQNHKQYEVQMVILEEQNIKELNHKLKYMKKPLLEMSDLIMLNNIKMIQLEYTLTVAYRLQVLSTWNGQKCHRYAINEDLPYLCDKIGTQFYLLPVQQSKHIKILIFSAEKYLKEYKKGLNMYLYQAFEKNEWSRKHVQNMWVQMLRFPQHYTERQQFFLNSYRIHQFDSIKKQMIIGDTFEWFTDIQIQNGIQYQLHKNDLHFKKPLGVGVITNKNCILYSRILELGQQTVSENA